MSERRRRSIFEIPNDEWHDIMASANTVDEVFDLADRGYDRKEWRSTHRKPR